MQKEILPGPTCQSCGRSMKSQSIFGTEEGLALNTEYCRYCYERGKFTEPDITKQQMIEKVADLIVFKKKIPRSVALKKAGYLIPMLKRWKKEGSNTPMDTSR